MTSFGATSNRYFLDLSVASRTLNAKDVCDEAVEGRDGAERKERGELFFVETDMTLSRQEGGCLDRAVYWFGYLWSSKSPHLVYQTESRKVEDCSYRPT